MNYRRITQEERYQIAALMASGLSLRSVGKQLNRSPSSISRELKKGGKSGYHANLAQKVTASRLQGRYFVRYKINGRVKKYVSAKALLDWSPQQIAGRMKLEGTKNIVSHQTIYRFLERDKKCGGKLWKRLRILRKQRKDRKKPSWKPATQPFPERDYLKDRPKIVDKRNRIGDYERDTVFGLRNGPLLLTIVDRTSRLLKLAWIAKKSADLIHGETVKALKSERVLTITNDNGSEFARHPKTSKRLQTKIYFTHAYRAWERGTNENTNGLIRQYFPKKKEIGKWNSKDIKKIENLMNSRPRKCLGFKTPLEVHKKYKSSVLR